MKIKKVALVNLIFFIFLAGLISLGQLQRVSISNTINFYLHEVLILGWTIIALIKERKLLSRKFFLLRNDFKEKDVFLKRIVYCFTVIIFIGWIRIIADLFFNNISMSEAMIPFLYCARYATYTLFFFLVSQLKPLKKVYFSLIYCGMNIVFLLLGYYQYFVFPDGRNMFYLGWDNHYFRLTGTLFDPAFMGIIFCWFFLWLLMQKASRRIPKYFLLVITLIALLLTYSRAAYLALLIAVIYYSLIKYGKNIKFKSLLANFNLNNWKRVALFFISLMVVSFSVLFLRQMQDKGDSTNILRINSLMIRWETIKSTVDNFAPIDFWVGRGMFRPMPYESNWLIAKTSEVKVTAAFPDNILLLGLSFWGIIGSTLICYLMFVSFKVIYKNKIFIFIVAWITSALFCNSIFQPFTFIVMGWLMIIFQKESLLRPKKDDKLC